MQSGLKFFKKESCELVLNGYKVFNGEGGKLLEMDGGGYTTPSMYVIPQSCTLKNLKLKILCYISFTMI